MNDPEARERTWPVFDDFVPLKDGSLLAMKAGIEMKRSSDGGKTWSEWSVLRENEDEETSDAIEGTSISLLNLSTGELGLIYHSVDQALGPVDVHKIAVIYFRKSEDDGKTWSPPVQVSPAGVASHAREGTAIQLENGRIVVPASTGFGLDRTHKDSYSYARGQYRGKYHDHESHGHEALLCAGFTLMSDDGGGTWHRSINGELLVAYPLGSGVFGDFEENYVVEMKDHRLLMFGRNCLGRVFKSYSEDDGETWHLPEPTDLASSAGPSLLKRIPGKEDLLVIWNQVSADEIRRGLRRARLSTAISRNDGETWECFKNLECNGAEDLTRIEPEAVAHVCALDETGLIPDDYILCSYPNVGFFDGHCVVTYKYFELGRQGKRMQKVKILPNDWFYSE